MPFSLLPHLLLSFCCLSLPSLLYPFPSFPFVLLPCFSYLCLFTSTPVSGSHPCLPLVTQLPPLRLQILHVKSPGWAPIVSPPHSVPLSLRDLWSQLCLLCIFPAPSQFFALPGDYLGALAFPPSLPPSTQQALNSAGRKRRRWSWAEMQGHGDPPVCPPSFPSSSAHLGKSQLEAGEDSLGLLEQT